MAVERTGWHHMKMQVLTRPQENKPAPDVRRLPRRNRPEQEPDRLVVAPLAAELPRRPRTADRAGRRGRVPDVLRALGGRAPAAARRGGPGRREHVPARTTRGRAAATTPTASLSAIPDDLGDHIVQIAPHALPPGAGQRGRGVLRTRRRARPRCTTRSSARSTSAREYIYIEDQYMTSANSGGAGDEIFEALVDAATRCKALILVFPQGTSEQWLFGRRAAEQAARAAAAELGRAAGPGVPAAHPHAPAAGPAGRISGRGRRCCRTRSTDDATADPGGGRHPRAGRAVLGLDRGRARAGGRPRQRRRRPDGNRRPRDRARRAADAARRRRRAPTRRARP